VVRASRHAQGPTQHFTEWVPGALTLAIQRPDSGANHSPPSSAEVKNAWSYTSTTPICLHGAVLSGTVSTLHLCISSLRSA
jgi:hypothetical protein